MKKVVALWGVLLMFVSILPTTVVQAEDLTPVDQAKKCIDRIIKAAPTPESYSFSETLADDIDALGRLLQEIKSLSDMEMLDEYVTEKTTVQTPEATATATPEVTPTAMPEVTPAASSVPSPAPIPDTGSSITITRYRKVQKFYQDYADAQQKVLTELAKPLDQTVASVLSTPLTRDNYETAKKQIDAATKHVRAAMDSDNINAMNQIRELLELVDAADKTFYRIQELNKDSTDSDYKFFVEDVATARTAYGLYESKFAELRRYTKYANCLVKSVKNALFSKYSLYQKALYVEDVEKAFDDLGVYDTLDDTVKKKLVLLQEAVDAGKKSEFSISVYDYYRGEAIQNVLNQYKKISYYEELMAMTSEIPANKTELTAGLRAYTYYTEELSEDERKLLPSQLVQKMNNAILLNTNCEEVMQAIEKIGIATSEKEYEAFVERYEEAYKRYRLFVNTYSGISDISSLIPNVDRLDSATDVKELIQSIRQMEDTEDAVMCSKKLQIESLLNAYNQMNDTRKSGVYNIQVLQDIFQDVQTASELRLRLDVLRGGDGGYSLLDEETVKKLRMDYEKMNERAKRYFGKNYLSQLETVEKELEVQNLNAALRVSTLINQIGTVDARARDRISSARKAYEALSANQKLYVANLSTLESAEHSYGKLSLSVAKATVSNIGGSYRYAGIALTPAVTVQLNGVTLTRDIDYRVSYSSNTNVGTAKLVIRGIGFYTGTLTKTFSISPETVVGASINGCKAKYSYTGKSVKPIIQVVANGKVLRKGVDYTVTYKNNKKRGAASIIVKGIGNYTGAVTTSFSIVRTSIKDVMVSGVKASYRKTGKAICPKVKVKKSGVTLKKKKDYLVSYKKNKKKGTATVVIMGIGNYSGTKKIKFKIV